MYFGVTDVGNRLTVHDNAAQVLPGVKQTNRRRLPKSRILCGGRWLSPRFLMGAAGALSLGVIAYSLNDGLQSHEKRPEKRPRRTLIPRLQPAVEFICQSV
jgi:hypothetical protein